MNALNDAPIKTHTGPDCIHRFRKDLLEIEVDAARHVFNEENINMDIKDREDLLKAKQCFLCKKDFTDKTGMGRQAVPDFASRNYRGCAHLKCYNQEKSWFRIPVYFHNFRGYDGHLIVSGLAVDQGAKIDIIGQGMEKYLTLHWSKYI